MRFAMGVSESDPLPPPSHFSADAHAQMPELVACGVPDWLTPTDPYNTLWVERMITEVLEEAEAGGLDKVPPEDLEADAVRSAARTVFINLCRKYQAEHDPAHAAKKEISMKARRRWARKDLKQKRRAKAATDPSCVIDVPTLALHMDYMSSEYSSAGENSDEGGDNDIKTARQQRWEQESARSSPMADATDPSRPGDKSANAGTKVVEVRTPSWRSSQVRESGART